MPARGGAGRTSAPPRGRPCPPARPRPAGRAGAPQPQASGGAPSGASVPSSRRRYSRLNEHRACSQSPGVRSSRATRPAALLGQGAHGVGQRHPRGARVAGGGVASEQRHGLDVDAPHRRRVREGEVEDRAEAVEVDAAHHRRHEHDAEAGLCAAEDGLLLELGERAAAEREVGRVVHAVELQEHRGETGLGEPLRVAWLARQPQPVACSAGGNRARAGVPGRRPRAGRRVPSARPRRAARCSRGRPPAGAGTTPRSSAIEGSTGAAGRPLPAPPPSLREAHRAREVAALRHLEQHAARLPGVPGAEAARRSGRPRSRPARSRTRPSRPRATRRTPARRARPAPPSPRALGIPASATPRRRADEAALQAAEAVRAQRPGRLGPHHRHHRRRRATQPK